MKRPDGAGDVPTGLRRMQAPLPLALWHLASLDAPTVAVAWSLAFASATGVQLPLWVPILLGLVTWAVYIGDRLLDARTGLRTVRLHRLRERHRFHWRHRRALFPLAVGAAISAGGIIVTCMPPVGVERNSVLAAATLAYFTGVHSPRHVSSARVSRLFSRLGSLVTAELPVGVLFTAGCVLPVLSRASRSETAAILGMAAYFALLAWLNCFAIQCWEDARESCARFPVSGRALVLGAVGLVAAVLAVPHGRGDAALLASGATAALLLAVLDGLRRRLTPLTLRACADLVLLAPAALLLR